MKIDTTQGTLFDRSTLTVSPGSLAVPLSGIGVGSYMTLVECDPCEPGDLDASLQLRSACL